MCQSIHSNRGSLYSIRSTARQHSLIEDDDEEKQQTVTTTYIPGIAGNYSTVILIQALLIQRGDYGSC